MASMDSEARADLSIQEFSEPVAKPIGSLKLDVVGVSVPQKLANAESGLFPGEPVHPLHGVGGLNILGSLSLSLWQAKPHGQ